MAINKIYKGTNELENVVKIYKGSELLWEKQTGPTIPTNYILFQSPKSFTLKVYDNKKHWDGTLYYSTDTTNWSEWDGTTTLSSVANKLYLAGTGNTIITGSSDYCRWVLTGSNIECIGNIESLLDWETVELGNHPTMADYCYARLFASCSSLTTAPSLPATTLAAYCYQYMFNGCSLTTAPSLPATTLADGCYQYMFQNCRKLTVPPSLPATTLAYRCYYYMFRNCTELTTITNLPALTLVENCYYGMFYDCSKLKVSATKTGSYYFSWRIPASGTGTIASSYWNNGMLTGTGGTFKSNPSIHTLYYVENPPV